MGIDRRTVLKNGAFALLGAGFLGRLDRVAAMQSESVPSLKRVLENQATGNSERLILKPKKDAEGPPPPADYDRLPLSWNKKTVKRFKEKTGVPMVINTSFNVRGEPIVCTPADAHRCFMATGMDALVIENFILLKSDQPDAEGLDRAAYLSEFELD